MAREQAEAYLASKNFFKDLTCKAREAGYDATEEDFISIFSSINKEDLDNVVGGVGVAKDAPPRAVWQTRPGLDG